MLADEAPEYGFPSPEALGDLQSPCISPWNNADAWVGSCGAAGARLITPVANQSYCDRSGSVRRSVRLRLDDRDAGGRHVSGRNAAAHSGVGSAAAVERQRSCQGFPYRTPYLVVETRPRSSNSPRVCSGRREHRSSGPGGGIHAEVRHRAFDADDWRGSKGHPLDRPSMPTALHVYARIPTLSISGRSRPVPRPLAPVDQEYGERSAGVKDPSVMSGTIATAKGEHHVPAGLRTVNVYPPSAACRAVIRFMERALGAAGSRSTQRQTALCIMRASAIGDRVEMGKRTARINDADDVLSVPARTVERVPPCSAKPERRRLTSQRISHTGTDAGVKDPSAISGILRPQLRETHGTE